MQITYNIIHHFIAIFKYFKTFMLSLHILTDWNNFYYLFHYYYFIMKLNLYSKVPDFDAGPDYDIIKTIGKGSYGIVCEAIHKPTAKHVAIKKLFKIFEDNIDCKRLLREINILRMLKHPKISSNSSTSLNRPTPKILTIFT